MNLYFAGYYCDASELAENAIKQRPVDNIFVVLGVLYVCLIIFLNKRFKDFSKAQRIASCIIVPLIGIIGLAGYFLLSFVSMPHLCGNS